MASGLLLDAAVEGASLGGALREYLSGPVLLQGFVLMLQPPLTDPCSMIIILLVIISYV